MTSSTENVKLGVCNVLFDGADLGYTKGGVEVEVSTSTHEVKIDQFGETPIGEIVTGRMVRATVPLAETTVEKLVQVMPGATLVSNGAKATGSVTFVTSAPADGDWVKIGPITFTFRTTPVSVYDLAIPANITAAAAAITTAINESPCGFTATAAAGVASLTARERGTASNVTFTKNGTNITVSGATGGTNPTKAKVVVTNASNTNLLSIAKKLVLRPVGTTGPDDFTIYKAATAGALNFSYNFDQERVYSVEFKGYSESNGNLFEVGHPGAV